MSSGNQWHDNFRRHLFTENILSFDIINSDWLGQNRIQDNKGQQFHQNELCAM